MERHSVDPSLQSIRIGQGRPPEPQTFTSSRGEDLTHSQRGVTTMPEYMRWYTVTIKSLPETESGLIDLQERLREEGFTLSEKEVRAQTNSEGLERIRKISGEISYKEDILTPIGEDFGCPDCTKTFKVEEPFKEDNVSRPYYVCPSCDLRIEFSCEGTGGKWVVEGIIRKDK